MLSEQVPGLTITLWNGLFVPKGTPEGIDAKDDKNSFKWAAETI